VSFHIKSKVRAHNAHPGHSNISQFHSTPRLEQTIWDSELN
jgi:hypothetical protein